jgi:hypothetical protein
VLVREMGWVKRRIESNRYIDKNKIRKSIVYSAVFGVTERRLHHWCWRGGWDARMQ